MVNYYKKLESTQIKPSHRVGILAQNLLFTQVPASQQLSPSSAPGWPATGAKCTIMFPDNQITNQVPTSSTSDAQHSPSAELRQHKDVKKASKQWHLLRTVPTVLIFGTLEVRNCELAWTRLLWPFPPLFHIQWCATSLSNSSCRDCSPPTKTWGCVPKNVCTGSFKKIKKI